MNRTLKYIEGDLDTKSIKYLIFDSHTAEKEVELFCLESGIRLRKHRINVEVLHTIGPGSGRAYTAIKNGYFFEDEQDESLVQLKFGGEYKPDISLYLKGIEADDNSN